MESGVSGLEPSQLALVLIEVRTLPPYSAQVQDISIRRR